MRYRQRQCLKGLLLCFLFSLVVTVWIYVQRPALTQRSPWARFTTRPTSTSPNGVSVLHWGSA